MSVQIGPSPLLQLNNVRAKYTYSQINDVRLRAIQISPQECKKYLENLQIVILPNISESLKKKIILTNRGVGVSQMARIGLMLFMDSPIFLDLKC